MNDLDWMNVFAMWQHRVKNRVYLSDAQPYNLTPSELSELVVSSLYSKKDIIYPVDPYHFTRLKNSRWGMPKCLLNRIDTHKKNAN